MITLINCIIYPDSKVSQHPDGYMSLKDFFPDPIDKGNFGVDISPRDALSRLLPETHLGSYLGMQPWFIEPGRGYLDISEVEGGKVDGSIEDLLELPNFSFAKRPQRLTREQSDKLAKNTLYDLGPEMTYDLFISQKGFQVDRAYSDVLQVLGRDITPEQVKAMLSVQSEKLEQSIWESRQRDAETQSILWNQVVGGEVFI